MLSFTRNVHVPVHSLPAQVLQGRQCARQRPEQLQRDFLSSRVDIIHAASVPYGQSASRRGHVVMDEFEHAVEARRGLRALGVRLQVEGLVVALHAQVLGARVGFDAEREEVSVVRAVPQEERSAGFRAQHVIGLFTADGAPVEAALLELHHGVLNHVKLQVRAEGFKAVMLQTALEQAAAHSAVKLTVSDHGAKSAVDEEIPDEKTRVRIRLQNNTFNTTVRLHSTCDYSIVFTVKKATFLFLCPKTRVSTTCLTARTM